nr:50S ribosomal protein L11 methyltransferase [Roseospira goensis]
MDAAARRRFIRTWTTVAAPPHVPDLRLHLATEITPLWQASEALLRERGVAPPFWAFAWPGGQALARHVLDDPELVRGRSVLDLASGCGIAGIAAARAGADAVTGADTDPMAAEALTLNATLNGVADRVVASVVDLLPAADAPAGGAAPGRWAVILAGDVCYEQPMADRAARFLRAQAAAGAVVLLADPGRAHVPRDGLELLARYAVATTLELEDRLVRETAVYRVRPPSPPNQGDAR